MEHAENRIRNALKGRLNQRGITKAVKLGILRPRAIQRLAESGFRLETGVGPGRRIGHSYAAEMHPAYGHASLTYYFRCNGKAYSFRVQVGHNGKLQKINAFEGNFRRGKEGKTFVLGLDPKYTGEYSKGIENAFRAAIREQLKLM